LYPSEFRNAINDINEWVYPNINNGVYLCGFAKSQEAYNEAIVELYTALDRVEAILASSRYIAGAQFTEADIRLFVTLFRFDEVYSVYFKCNKKLIREYPNMHNYCKELFQIFVELNPLCVNMRHIKSHYYCSHAQLNAYAIIPAGSNVTHMLMTSHDRHRLPTTTTPSSTTSK